MKDIIEAIKRKNTFSDVAITDFAPSGKWADSIAKNQQMKTTQLRKVFTSIKQMELRAKGKKDEDDFNDPSLYMMIPHLAYAKARGFIEDDFYELVKIIVGDGQSGKIKKVKDFKRFSDFMTAIVAYNKENSK